ncbi:DUF2059 domain-containing protein [Erythrobacter sp. JK5]|uniref:DUF2059 domain-containing protein n=1 Tax=Erythrobacter sp. JK5 TaxID=2829500 RepID=UPI001BAB5284|nr:DUF2059 domain-containing protein [Erythrobacter sp. JK5]QUL37449.1 DUF2059 domain-containing protein [Erythrobacter sp. JK5]
MIKHSILVGTAGFALLAAAPLTAQDEGVETEATDMQAPGAPTTDMFANMFGEAEPLSAEQTARLPAAELVVERIFPAGTYARMMEDTMKPMMDGMMGSFMDLPINEIAKLTGLYTEDMPELGDGSVNEIMAILDPAFRDRSRMIADTTIQLVSDTMSRIEPSYRAGLARAYAVRFTEAELADLNAYFATPTGAKYAGESMLIYTDPQVMSAMNEMMPAMMGMMPEMMEQIAAANEQFPPARTYSELSPQEQARLSELLGVSPEELRASEPETGTESGDADPA